MHYNNNIIRLISALKSALPQGQGESYYQFPQFETFDKCAGDEVFSRHGSLDKHEVNQPTNQMNELNHAFNWVN